MNFFDADRLAGKDLAEVNLFAQTEAAATGDDNDLVVKGIVDIGQSLIGAGGRLIDLGRAPHIQGFVRTFVVEDFDEVVEASLLLSANAITYRPAQVLLVRKSEPAQMPGYAGTDAPLQPTEWNYTLQVRVGTKVYDVRYATSLDFFPAALKTGASVDARVNQGRIYLETPTGELEATIIGQHQTKADMLAQSAR